MTSPRAALLREATDITESVRNATYGPPTLQMSWAGILKKWARSAEADATMHIPHKRMLCDGEWEAIDMILAKLSRILCGPRLHRDNYLDLAAYAAIAYECALEAERIEGQALGGEDD